MEVRYMNEIRAQHMRRFSYLLHAIRFSTLAPKLMSQYATFFRRNFGGGHSDWLPSFLKFCVECRRISTYNIPHRFLPFFLVFTIIEAILTTTIGPTVDTNPKTLAIEFQAICLFTCTSHVLYFVSMMNFDLSWRCCTFSPINFIRKCVRASDWRPNLQTRCWVLWH